MNLREFEGIFGIMDKKITFFSYLPLGIFLTKKKPLTHTLFHPVFVFHIQQMVLIISPTQPLNACGIKHKLWIGRDNLNTTCQLGQQEADHFLLVSPMETAVPVIFG